MFEAIELLVDYYTKNADGLPGILTRPIEPIDEATKGLKSLQIAQEPIPPQIPQNGQYPHQMAQNGQFGHTNGSTILPPVAQVAFF